MTYSHMISPRPHIYQIILVQEVLIIALAKSCNMESNDADDPCLDVGFTWRSSAAKNLIAAINLLAIE